MHSSYERIGKTFTRPSAKLQQRLQPNPMFGLIRKTTLRVKLSLYYGRFIIYINKQCWMQNIWLHLSIPSSDFGHFCFSDTVKRPSMWAQTQAMCLKAGSILNFFPLKPCLDNSINQFLKLLFWITFVHKRMYKLQLLPFIVYP